MLIIEITKEDVMTETRIIPARGEGQQPRTVYDQPCLFHMGGRSQLESKLSHDHPDLKLEEGLYVLNGSSYKLNDYGAPELKRSYQQSLMPLSDALKPYQSRLTTLLKS